MATPRPGKPVRGSATGRPIMALLDLLGRRWVLRILWELREGPLGFRPLQRRCDEMSPSVLSQRLGELTQSRILKQTDSNDYELSGEGRELFDALMPLNGWAERWAKRFKRGAKI
jgi:DNA-binding HxlR family transcriptional regulator